MKHRIDRRSARLPARSPNPFGQGRPGLLAALGLACAIGCGPAAAQRVGDGAGGREVHIVRDSAASRTVAKVYEGLFSFVRIERAEPGAPPSLQPVQVSAAVLRQALAELRLGSDALFNDDELAEIVPPLVAGLARVGPDQDLSFAVPGRHSGMVLLAPRSVTTGRMFRDAGGLQLIVGLAQHSFEEEFIATGVLIAFEPGRRAGPLDATIRLADNQAGSIVRRGDWVSLPVGSATVPGAPAIDAKAAASGSVVTTPMAAPMPPPAPATPITGPAAAAPPAPAVPPAAAVPPAGAPPATPDADALYRKLSERLKALQRLRDAGLITPQEYEQKRREILSEL